MVELNSRLNILIARGEVCHRLSAKTLFYESVVNDPSETVHSAEGPFWCAVYPVADRPRRQVRGHGSLPGRARPGLLPDGVAFRRASGPGAGSLELLRRLSRRAMVAQPTVIHLRKILRCEE